MQDTTTLYTLQCAPRIDHISDDGQEFTQLPYPYHITADGEVQQKGFWGEHMRYIVGFQKHSPYSSDSIKLDAVWAYLVALGEAQSVVGMYPVIVRGDGTLFAHDTPVDTIQAREYPAEQLDYLNA